MVTPRRIAVRRTGSPASMRSRKKSRRWTRAECDKDKVPSCTSEAAPLFEAGEPNRPWFLEASEGGPHEVQARRSCKRPNGAFPHRRRQLEVVAQSEVAGSLGGEQPLPPKFVSN